MNHYPPYHLLGRRHPQGMPHLLVTVIQHGTTIKDVVVEGRIVPQYHRPQIRLLPNHP